MPELNFVDRSFNKDHSVNYHLSIQADRNGLAYCIRNGRHKEFIVFRKYRFDHVYLESDLVRQIISVLDRDEILHLPFLDVHFLSYTQQNTLVPSGYFSSDHLADYMDFNAGGATDGELFSNNLRVLDSYNVFSLSRALVSLITLHFKKVEFSSQASPFLWNVSNQSESLNNTAMYVGLNADFFDVAVTGSSKLLLYNTFQYVNETDLLYYVLYVCKQLSLKTKDLPLILSGEMSSRLVYSEMLRQYLPATDHDAAAGLPAVSTGLTPSITYKYLNLFNLQACALSVESIKAE
jgi:hypothetical protein